MTNSKSTHSRTLREHTARQWEKDKLAAGYKRVMIMIPPDVAAKLEKLAVEYETKTNAIIAAIRALAAKSGDRL